MLCIGYIVALLGELDYNVSRRDHPISELDITWVEERWKDLQAWNRQCARYCDSVEAIIDSFEIPLSENEASSSWESCEKDFHVIYRKLRGMKARSDDLISSFTRPGRDPGKPASIEGGQPLLTRSKECQDSDVAGHVVFAIILCVRNSQHEWRLLAWCFPLLDIFRNSSTSYSLCLRRCISGQHGIWGQWRTVFETLDELPWRVSKVPRMIITEFHSGQVRLAVFFRK